MLTTTTLFTTFAMAGVLVGAATTQTVSSSSGVTYNCPNVEPMEVAYAESCPARSKTMMYDNTGATSQTYYASAPNNYNNVRNGDYTLTCAYRAPGSDTDAITCTYFSGTGQPLQLSEGQDAECPIVDQSSPQPSGGSTPPNMGERSLTKRYDQSPEFNCPWNSDNQAKYDYSSQINSGTRSDEGTPFTYQCVVMTAPNEADVCRYKSDGVLQPQENGVAQPDCPSQLCTVNMNARRSLKRGVYVDNDPIRSRQVSAASLREAGKKRMPRPSSK